MKDISENSVRVKGFGDGLCITLNPDDDIDYIIDELTQKFDEIRDLAAGSKITIDIGESDESAEIIHEIGEFLKAEYGVASVERLPEKKDIPPSDDASDIPESIMDQLMGQGMGQGMNRLSSDRISNVMMLTGRIRSGQDINADNHLLILGDVNPGAEVMAGGDIIIVGSLLGTAIAGQPDNTDALIFALDFRPTQLQIGTYVAAGAPTSPGGVSEYAHVENGAIVVDNYLKNHPFIKVPWPQLR